MGHNASVGQLVRPSSLQEEIVVDRAHPEALCLFRIDWSVCYSEKVEVADRYRREAHDSLTGT